GAGGGAAACVRGRGVGRVRRHDDLGSVEPQVFPASWPASWPASSSTRRGFGLDEGEVACRAGSSSRLWFLEDALNQDPSQDRSFVSGLGKLAHRAGPDGLLLPARFAALLNRKSSEFRTQPSPLRVRLENPRAYKRIDPEGSFIPAEVEGELRVEEKPAQPSLVAVAVNGVIRGVTATFSSGEGAARFLVIVPEASFTKGSNRIDFFLVTGSEDEPRLEKLQRIPWRR
ncbi:MAG: hypothetical protein ACE5JX_20550, partial [Acidobacteriota bacterium]